MRVINFLVPFGQLGIGVSLILGLFTRFGAAMGTLMMLFFFVAAWDFEFGIVNQHLTYALVTAFIGYIGAGNYFGLDRPLGESMNPTVRRWLLSGETRRCPPATSHSQWHPRPRRANERRVVGRALCDRPPSAHGGGRGFVARPPELSWLAATLAGAAVIAVAIEAAHSRMDPQGGSRPTAN